jgi:hypothetical protein
MTFERSSSELYPRPPGEAPVELRDLRGAELDPI